MVHLKRSSKVRTDRSLQSVSNKWGSSDLKIVYYERTPCVVKDPDSEVWQLVVFIAV